MYIWSDRMSQVSVQVWLVFHHQNCLLFCSAKLIYFDLFHFFFVTLLCLLIIKSKPAICRGNITRNEDHFVGQISNTSLLKPTDSIHRFLFTACHLSHIHLTWFSLLPRLHQLNNVWNNDERASENWSITWFRSVNLITPHYDVNRTRHRTCWNVRRYFLHSNLLPIHKDALRHLQIPLNEILTLLVRASDGCCVFVLLFYWANLCVANMTLEVSNQKLWLDFSSACYCTLDRHHTTKTACFQISDFVYLG